MHNQTETPLIAVEEIVCRFAPKRQNRPPITRETRLVDDLGIDSPRMIDIVLELEDRFDVNLTDADVEETQTLGDLLTLIERRRPETSR